MVSEGRMQPFVRADGLSRSVLDVIRVGGSRCGQVLVRLAVVGFGGLGGGEFEAVVFS